MWPLKTELILDDSQHTENHLNIRYREITDFLLSSEKSLIDSFFTTSHTLWMGFKMHTKLLIWFRFINQMEWNKKSTLFVYSYGSTTIDGRGVTGVITPFKGY